MKLLISKGLLVIVYSSLFLFIGCSSMKSISYSLVEDEQKSASISFSKGNPGVSFVYYNDISLPETEKGTQWDPILLPSNVALDITVHAYYYQSGGQGYSGGLLAGLIADAATSKIRNDRSVDDDVLFSCPPLEAGKKYKLSLKKEGGNPGKNILILTDIATGKNVCTQEFTTNTINYQQLPTIDIPNTYVIDTASISGKMEDNIRLINKSKNSNIEFMVYAHDQSDNTWFSFGVGTLKGTNDTDFIDSKFSGILKNYRFYAIEALDGKNYRYEISKERNDLYINILDM